MTSHVALEVSDREEAVELYGSVFGMEVAERKEAETVLELGDARFYVMDANDPRIYLDFAVEDLQQAVDTLEKAGASIDPVETDEGERSYMVTDPFGISFHLFEDGFADEE